MADYYADSSVLVKRHIREVGTDWLRAVVAPAAGNTIITAQISVVEVFSAFNRRVREGSLAGSDYAVLRADFTSLCDTSYQLIDLTVLVRDHARNLLERHPLRAYDAVQLASALAARDTLAAAGLGPLTFLSADDRLLDAARAEGLPVDDPNHH